MRPNTDILMSVVTEDIWWDGVAERAVKNKWRLKGNTLTHTHT